MAKPDFLRVHMTLRERLMDSLRDELDFTTQLAYMNRAFAPPAVKPAKLWLRETFQEAAEPEPFLFAQLHSGLGRYVLDIFYPNGAGTEPVDQLAKLIADSFGEIHSLNTQGVVVALDRVERLPGRKADEIWWMKPVVVYWRTYSPATTSTTG